MTIETLISTLAISKKTIVFVAQLKVILTTSDQINEYIERVQNYTGYGERGQILNKILFKMRKEQLQTDPMSKEIFLEMYLLNPLQALIIYFKEHIIPYQVERMKKWGVTVEQLVNLKQQDPTIRFEHALMTL